MVDRNLSWANAGPACRSLHKDAHLVVINDAQEQLEVAGLLASILSNNVGVHSGLLFCIRQRYFMHCFNLLDRQKAKRGIILYNSLVDNRRIQ